MATSDPNGNDNDNNITWHNHSLNRRDRWRAETTVGGHKGAVLWFTGLSGSGNSSIANEVELKLFESKKRTYLLDGDNIRHGLCSDLGFSLDDRRENIRRIGEVAKLMADSGLVVLVAFISPYRLDRDNIRNTITLQQQQKQQSSSSSSSSDDNNDDNTTTTIPFIEIYVKSSLSTCESRDPKGLYKLAREGKIQNFTGIDDPYEEPIQPEIILENNPDNNNNNNNNTVKQLSQEVIEWLETNRVLEISSSSTTTTTT